MLFNPTLIYETSGALNSEHKFALYKSWDEYVLCDYLERDRFIAAGYSDSPDFFLIPGNECHVDPRDVKDYRPCPTETECPVEKKRTRRKSIETEAAQPDGE